MAQPADARRRWLGLFCLTMAGGMLIWGLIVFGSRLRGFGFLIYWAVCFLFTMAAMFIAMLDMLAVRQRIREEQEALLRATITEIQRSKERPQRQPSSEGDSNGHEPETEG